ncbi:hypothetical protein PtoMrB4_06320 [Metapseudomonas otitidis]|uniref:Uncharacterized protein n=1 Tax=Metapseudomonas otitidis TaxID=319939 RepID=A0A679G908_9GAMM|nr:hypothetical protein PtoMrB4_06320 [Pseudomonas otitidis]
MAGQLAVILGEMVEGFDVSLWDDQEVHRRLWADVMERDNVIVFVQRARRDLPSDDFAEQTVHLDSPG